MNGGISMNFFEKLMISGVAITMWTAPLGISGEGGFANVEDQPAYIQPEKFPWAVQATFTGNINSDTPVTSSEFNITGSSNIVHLSFRHWDQHHMREQYSITLQQWSPALRIWVDYRTINVTPPTTATDTTRQFNNIGAGRYRVRFTTGLRTSGPRVTNGQVTVRN